MTKTYVNNINAGGVGKTHITFQGGMYLSEELKKKVLLIDLDPSRNLSNLLLNYLSKKVDMSVQEMWDSLQTQNKVRAIFEGGEFKPISITDTLDILLGDRTLYDLNKDIEKQDMINWYFDNEDRLNDYEYILIDTHNDESEVTKNALALADYVVAIVNADPKSLEKVSELKEQISDLKKKIRFGKTAMVNAEVMVVGNRLDTSTLGQAMRELLVEKEEKDPKTYKGYIEERVVVGKSIVSATPLCEMSKVKRGQDESIKKFYEKTWETLDKIYEINKKVNKNI